MYKLDQYIGMWWQFCTKMMTKEAASKFVEKAEPLGTMNYSLLSRKVEEIDEKYPWSLPIPSMALAVGVQFLVTLIDAILFAIKLYRLGITVNEAKVIAKRVTSNPMLCFRSLFSGKKTGGSNEPANEQRPPPEVPTAPSLPTTREIDLSPVCMSNIFKQVLQDERTGVKYGKYLDKQTHQSRQGPRAPLEIQELDTGESVPVPSSSL